MAYSKQPGFADWKLPGNKPLRASLGEKAARTLDMQDPGEDRTLLDLTVQIVGAYVATQKVPLSELGVVLRSVHATVRSFHDEIRPPGSKAAAREPAVPIDRSVTPEYLVCLEDGRLYARGDAGKEATADACYSGEPRLGQVMVYDDCSVGVRVHSKHAQRSIRRIHAQHCSAPCRNLCWCR
jgi:hypothetical protein